ncbi:MAG: hypothetical protein K0U79_16775 [Gammaproteobacteria bacterium]|nr:hypothetical protein [Gammaproteobacteria bacterium]
MPQFPEVAVVIVDLSLLGACRPGSPDASPALAGSVWVVSESDGVAADTRYAFLTGGKLIVDAGAGGGPPMVGR